MSVRTSGIPSPHPLSSTHLSIRSVIISIALLVLAAAWITALVLSSFNGMVVALGLLVALWLSGRIELP